MWFSAATAHLLLGFAGVFLHILAITSGYLTYCCLPISLNQSALSLMTFDVNKAFSHRDLSLCQIVLSKL